MKAHLKGLLENQERDGYVSSPPPQLIQKPNEFWLGGDKDIRPYADSNRHFVYQYTIPAATKYDEPVAMYQEIPRETAENIRKLRESEDAAMQALAAQQIKQKMIDDIGQAVEQHKKDRYYGWDTESKMEQLSKDWKPYDHETPYRYLDRLWRKIVPAPAPAPIQQPAAQPSWPAVVNDNVATTNGFGYTQIYGYQNGVQRDLKPGPLVVPPVAEIPKIPEPAEPKRRMMRK